MCFFFFFFSYYQTKSPKATFIADMRTNQRSVVWQLDHSQSVPVTILTLNGQGRLLQPSAISFHHSSLSVIQLHDDKTTDTRTLSISLCIICMCRQTFRTCNLSWPSFRMGLYCLLCMPSDRQFLLCILALKYDFCPCL